MSKKELVVKAESEVMAQPTMESALIEIVTRKDIDPERLEKFIALQFKLEDRQNEQAFNSSMSKFQGECPLITKKKKVEFKQTKYDYAPLDEIVHVIKPLLSKHGLSYCFDVKPTLNENMMEMVTTIAHVNGHSKMFSHYFKPYHDDMRMNESQRGKSALSYAKRSSLENALGVVTQGEDDDAKRLIDNPITEDSIKRIETLVREKNANKDVMLGVFKVSKLEDMDEMQANQAIKMLLQKVVK